MIALARKRHIPSGGRSALPAHAIATPDWRAVGRTIVSILAALFLWAGLAFVLDDPAHAPGPQQVLPELFEGLASGKMLPDLGATLWRVGLSFALAMGIGAALGILLGLSRRADAWFDPWLTIWNNIPALVLIVLCYLWIGLNETAAVMAVALNKVPLVAVMLREGVRARDPALSEMARVFGMGFVARHRHILIPQLMPHILAAARAGLALIWKVVLVVEFLGRSNGIGFRIHLNFQMFDIAGVLAWASAFVLVMLAIEWLVLAPLTAHAARWRRE
ncbi:NitT/TauT family transport system permease protein [Rhodobacter aestuarii]|uniref:NitT/TauT family transport system permease protein n=1 Tax=Rhodobacter aestuarii TaxID=453582 RepID=A0A1N7IWJ2_9RHOB|nr:ABC transporter permease subunit [Rhodobacter aestuarii]PTV97457.1 NitT/TauT family transport system permease protein [Rhodobacter aestuarii]SIS41463.1 NitT/TauT family transport system permease protein [Rhodobacter aestuarii]